MTPVIEVTGLTKRYAGQAVVDGISFHVDRGEIFGILGPNGAGKTTAVECLEGLRRRDAGQVRILGLDPKTDGHRLHQRLGVQLQETQLQDKIKVREALELYASFYPDPADWRELLDRWGLAGKRDTRFGKLVGQVREPAREPLSQRELDILGLISRGCSNREAAARLFISEATVKTHVLHIYAKLGVNDRAAAVAAGFERGLLPRPLKPDP
jgi:DNA-binding CsgD family transcriptional regulator